MMHLIDRTEALTMPLWQRERVFRERLLQEHLLREYRGKALLAEPRYCIVWEDIRIESEGLDSPVKITTPGGWWLTMALHGNILPPVHVYPLAVDANGAVRPGHGLHDDVVDAMSEAEAMEYLVRKDIPAPVWQDHTANRPRFRICNRTMVPKDRTHRNAWRLADFAQTSPA